MGGASYPAFRATGRCASTGREIAAGEAYFATLVERREGAVVTLSRMDFSTRAWQDGARPPEDAHVLGMWRTIASNAGEKKRPLLNDQDLLDMFEETPAVEDVRSIRFRYILALLLVRRRLLRVVTTRRAEGRTVLSVMRRGEAALGAAPRDVVDPGLDDGAVTEAVEQLLAMTESDQGASS
jgi:hypothetical protein